MKQRFLTAYLSQTLDQLRAETQSKLNVVTQQLNEAVAAESDNLEVIYAISDMIQTYQTELLRLQYATPDRIQYIIEHANTHCSVAEANYVQFDEDEQSVAEKLTLLINWGKSLAQAKVCNIDTSDKNDQFRAEASKLFKQISLRRCGQEKCVSLETWLTAMADILKIFAKLDISEQDVTFFLSFSLADSIIS
jgi:hypothetical protein